MRIQTTAGEIRVGDEMAGFAIVAVDRDQNRSRFQFAARHWSMWYDNHLGFMVERAEPSGSHVVGATHGD